MRHTFQFRSWCGQQPDSKSQHAQTLHPRKKHKSCSAEARAEQGGEANRSLSSQRHSGEECFGYSQLSLLTGFPSPVSIPAARNTQPQQEFREVRAEREEQALQFYGQEVQPVFRTSPFAAEEQRQEAQRTTAQILFIDEGNCCRSVIAEALFKKLLRNLEVKGMGIDARVESASLGPSLASHDPRVQRLAREAGFQLPARSSRCFDEIRDMVEFDLVIVMDRFDFEEVMREVSVLDTINPGGFYTARLRQFGHFAAASSSFRPEKAPWIHNEGIADPLYGNIGGDAEQAALWGALRKLRLSCAGLAQYLVQLQSRCIAGTSLQEALSQGLLCPLMDPSAPACGAAWGVPEKGSEWRPVWRTEEGNAGNNELGERYSIRVSSDGGSSIVRRPDPFYKVTWGYWQDIENLRKELEGWLDLYGSDRSRMPTNKELQASGASQICDAIEIHGGYFAVAQKFGLKSGKRNNRNRLTEPAVFQKELAEFVKKTSADTTKAANMPSIQVLRRKGRADLAYAISKLGGIVRAAEICGLPVKEYRLKKPVEPRAPTISLLHARELLWSRFPEAMRRGRMPSRTELLDTGNRQLAREITDLGGFKAVSAELGLQYCRAGRNTSKQSQSSGAP